MTDHVHMLRLDVYSCIGNTYVTIEVDMGSIMSGEKGRCLSDAKEVS